jgi:hypothetical protein
MIPIGDSGGYTPPPSRSCLGTRAVQDAGYGLLVPWAWLTAAWPFRLRWIA